MKRASFVLLMFILSTTQGQDLNGKYKDYFGHSLELRTDSTFQYEWRFDLIHIWAIGDWTFQNNLVQLHFINVFDTLTRTNQPDSLVLSIDPLPNRINEEEFVTSLLISGGQNHEGFSKNLKKKGKRLFLVNEKYKIVKTKKRGIWPQKKWPIGYKKWPTYYRKIE